jgi:23S rRNA pseudouridine2605 synthase
MDQRKAPDDLIRLNKFLADCGIASRRKADGLIAGGAVQVNGKTVYELGVRVHPTRDRVTVRGKPVQAAGQRVYIAFYKPENVLTSMADPEGRPTVKDFVEELPMRVFPVGRLDWDTEGLLLLTNDGDFAQKISHPRTAIPKTYLAKLNGTPTAGQLEKLRRGVTIPGGRASALSAERVTLGKSEKYSWVKIVITEGRNRQVRKMFEKIGFDVKKLKRTGIGQLELGPLRKGQYLFLGARGIAEALNTFNTKPRDLEPRRPRTPRPGRAPRKPNRPNRSKR